MKSISLNYVLSFFLVLTSCGVFGQFQDFDTLTVKLKKSNLTMNLYVLDYDASNHSNHYAGISIFDFRANQKAAVGPFVLEPFYRYYSNNRRWKFSARGMLGLIDLKLFEDLDREYNFKRAELELGGNFVFSESYKMKKNRLRFYVPLITTWDTATAYKVKLMWPNFRYFSVRGGLSYGQRSMVENKKIKNVLVGDLLCNQSDYYRGSRNVTIHLGIGRIRKAFISAKLENVGSSSSYLLGELYADLLIAPVVLVYGSSEYVPVGSSYDNRFYSKGRFDNSIYQFSRIGARIGGYLSYRDNGRFPKGFEQAVEIGWYPGPVGYNFEMLFRLKCFISK